MQARNYLLTMQDDPDDRPPIGRDPIPGERPHVWQEYKRDRDKPKEPGWRIIGRGWPIILIPLALILFHALSGTDTSPAFVTTIKQMF